MLPSQLFSLSLFHTQSVSLSIFYSISLCLFLSLSSSVSVSLFLSLFLVLSPSISLSVSIALFLSLSMSFISLSLTHRLYFFFKDTKHLSNRNVYTHNPTLGISSVTRFVKMLPLWQNVWNYLSIVWVFRKYLAKHWIYFGKSNYRANFHCFKWSKIEKVI